VIYYVYELSQGSTGESPEWRIYIGYLNSFTGHIDRTNMEGKEGR
jgi:hypothetical protein